MLRAIRTTTASAGKWNRAFSPSLSTRAPLPSRPAIAHAVTRTSPATAAPNDPVSLVASVTLASLLLGEGFVYRAAGRRDFCIRSRQGGFAWYCIVVALDLRRHLKLHSICIGIAWEIGSAA